VDPHISGLIAYARSLQGGGYMGAFPEALMTVLRERLVVTPIAPLPLEAVRYRDTILELYVGVEPQQAPLRQALCRLASGDWRRSEFVYQTDGPESLEDVLGLLWKEFVPRALSRQPYVWPRHRWTGFARSLADAGLLIGIHQLLLPTYQKFLAMHFGLRKGVVAAEERGAPGGASAEGGADDGRGASGSVDQGAHWAEANRANRGEAHRWLQQDPSGHLMFMRLAVTHSRQWPILEAAAGRLDRQAFGKLQHAQEYAAAYASLPKSHYSLRMRHLAFRMFSRQGCYLHQMVAVVHSGYSFRLFSLLRNADLEAAIGDECPKIKDEYSQRFLEHFPRQPRLGRGDGRAHEHRHGGPHDYEQARVIARPSTAGAQGLVPPSAAARGRGSVC
jgi:hypothetical protein